MAKKHRIKDIAALAGVSAGTVDRVIHNRGDVSAESRVRVEKVLLEINYNYNQHIISPEIRKQFRLLVILPQHTAGDYWDLTEKGISNAVNDYNDVRLRIKFLRYDQFDLYSCRQIFSEALTLKSDAVIIGPSFNDETVLFASRLFMQNIPYVFVDTSVNNTQPLAFFGPHSFQTGVVQAKLLTTVLKPGKDIVIFRAKRIGDESSIQSVTRHYGFMSYLKENYPDINIHSAQYNNADNEDSWQLLDQFFDEHTNIGGGVVFDTRAYLISEYLKAHDMEDVRLVGYGTDKRNLSYLKDGCISFIISERPEYQGYRAIKTIVEYLLYEKTTNVDNFTPIDILIKETVDFYTV